MSSQGEGSVALLPEPFEVSPEAVDKAAPAARAAAARLSQAHRRRTGPLPEATPEVEAPPEE